MRNPFLVLLGIAFVAISVPLALIGGVDPALWAQALGLLFFLGGIWRKR